MDEWERARVRAWRKLAGRRGGDTLKNKELSEVGASVRALSEEIGRASCRERV